MSGECNSVKEAVMLPRVQRSITMVILQEVGHILFHWDQLMERLRGSDYGFDAKPEWEPEASEFAFRLLGKANALRSYQMRTGDDPTAMNDEFDDF